MNRVNQDKKDIFSGSKIELQSAPHLNSSIIVKRKCLGNAHRCVCSLAMLLFECVRSRARSG